MDKILIVDHNPSFLSTAEISLEKHFEVLAVNTGKNGLEFISKEKFAAILLDINLPDMTGMDLLVKIKKEVDPRIPVIISTNNGDISTAVEAIHLGAADFIPKKYDTELLSKKIKDVIYKNKLESKVHALENDLTEQYDCFVFKCEVMRRINLEIQRHGIHNEHILLCGETGTGKDLIAKEIHKRSLRGSELFLTVPINTLNETLLESELFGYEKGAFTGAENSKIGILEAGNKGTVYIPEVSEINERIQIKLLEFMQGKVISRVGSSGKKIKLDVRVIMASNKNLKELVEQNKFRSDLYYGISTFTLRIPPLRERKEDIRYLLNYFLDKYSKYYGKKGLRIDHYRNYNNILHADK